MTKIQNGVKPGHLKKNLNPECADLEGLGWTPCPNRHLRPCREFLTPDSHPSVLPRCTSSWRLRFRLAVHGPTPPALHTWATLCNALGLAGNGQTVTSHQNGLSGTDPANHIPACRKPNHWLIVRHKVSSRSKLSRTSSAESRVRRPGGPVLDASPKRTPLSASAAAATLSGKEMRHLKSRTPHRNGSANTRDEARDEVTKKKTAKCRCRHKKCLSCSNRNDRGTQPKSR